MSRITRWYHAARTNNWIKTIRRLLTRALNSYIILIILGVIVGLQVAPMALNLSSGQPTSGTVAIVPLQGGITGVTAATAGAQLRQAREDPSIDAVVLLINSGGGGAASSQEIYLEVKKTADEMPVIVIADAIALSGGYHAAVGGDEIIVKPGTLIGNVGVVLTLPQDVAPIDSILTTGPDKLSGANTRDWYYKSEGIKRAFVNAVVTNRGETLNLSPEEVAHGTIYTGAEAVENGFADRYGTIPDAIDRAASQAGLANYNVMVMSNNNTAQFLTQTAYVASDAPKKELVSPTYFTGHPSNLTSPTIVMIPASTVRAALGEQNTTTWGTEVTINGTASP